jgi:hypothetical protein
VRESELKELSTLLDAVPCDVKVHNFLVFSVNGFLTHIREFQTISKTLCVVQDPAGTKTEAVKCLL